MRPWEATAIRAPTKSVTLGRSRRLRVPVRNRQHSRYRHQIVKIRYRRLRVMMSMRPALTLAVMETQAMEMNRILVRSGSVLAVIATVTAVVSMMRMMLLQVMLHPGRQKVTLGMVGARTRLIQQVVRGRPVWLRTQAVRRLQNGRQDVVIIAVVTVVESMTTTALVWMRLDKALQQAMLGKEACTTRTKAAHLGVE